MVGLWKVSKLFFITLVLMRVVQCTVYYFLKSLKIDYILRTQNFLFSTTKPFVPQYSQENNVYGKTIFAM